MEEGKKMRSKEKVVIRERKDRQKERKFGVRKLNRMRDKVREKGLSEDVKGSGAKRKWMEKLQRKREARTGNQGM